MFRTLWVCVCLVLMYPAAALAQPGGMAHLVWDPSPDADVTGYIVEYGTAPGMYTKSVDVGAKTQFALSSLPVGTTFYMAVVAYNSEGDRSAHSSEIVYPAPVVRSADANTELLWRHAASGTVARWTMQGLQQTGGASLGPAPVDLAWRLAGAGDFNADGGRDLVWQHRDGWLAVWLMRDTQLLDGRLLLPERVADPDWRIHAVADMNGDRKADLIWQHHGTGHLAAWLMDGARLVSGVLLTPERVPDLGWQVAGASDFDADGKADLLWRHETSGALAVWLMDGVRQRAGSAIDPAAVTDPAWKIAALADVNSDARADIIWQHTDGRLAVWVMNGLTMAYSSTLIPGAVVDPKWRIMAGR